MVLDDINKMNGYEFESFIAELLRKMGFVVEETPLSRDSGIDLIAYSREPIFKGKYLIQCKRWEGSIGEPVVRDLYGVVISNNANKGIIITNSFFTKQAVDFANGKNIELVDGNELIKLIHNYFHNILINQHSIDNHFTKIKEFEYNKYIYYKQRVDADQRNLDAYMDLFHLLYSYIKSKNMDILYSGLVEECINLCEEIIRRFGSKGKKGIALKELFTTVKGNLFMLLGKIDNAFEIMQKSLDFNANNFLFNLNNFGFCFIPEHYVYTNVSGSPDYGEGYSDKIFDLYLVIYKANLLKMLIYINDEYSSKYLYNKFISYYRNILEKANEERVFSLYGKQIMTSVASKNYKLVTEQINAAMGKKDLYLFIPTALSLNTEGYLTYSKNSFININEIASYWTSKNDLNKQKERLKFLVSLHE